MRGEATGSTDGEIVLLPRARRVRGRYGEYEVLAPLARGGMGGVFLAAHVETGEHVALKVVDPQFASHAEITRRLFAEHQLASSARHHGLLEIHDARTTPDGQPYLVMEYLAGETLGQIADRWPLQPAQIVAVCAQVASALTALHEAGVMHGDVKPENVFVLAEPAGGLGWPRVKVIDFGVSRRIGEPLGEDSSIAGTPWCMAPEQWQGRPEAASDVYSLGCMLYELTTGQQPFEGSLPALMTAHLEQRPARPTWLARIPLELERLILRALAKQPFDRPSMSELARELSALADGYLVAGAVTELRAAG